MNMFVNILGRLERALTQKHECAPPHAHILLNSSNVFLDQGDRDKPMSAHYECPECGLLWQPLASALDAPDPALPRSAAA